ncbi:ABC1 kinase family protein [Streptomyces sp. NPDC050504]|uniref:ABC1 kinase family protein n=1 Tax=Streptomyces sp. NPDC050504 TaxID=3365618 RepID=UPI00379FA4AD
MSGELPKGAVRRSLKVATLPLGFAGRTAFGLARRIAGGAEEAIRAEIEERTAKQLFAVIGELKGGAQKFAQVLSVMESGLPEGLVKPYRAALTSLQEAGPALPARAVHQVLREQLGEDWRADLPEFADKPVATASIGQVHRARWRDGTEVAVKVQHPGAGEALASDLGHLTRIGWILDRVTGGEMNAKEILAELRERMVEELDYVQEAESQRVFAKAFADDPDFFVPRVVAGTERVLVTEWLAGEPVSAVMADGTREERDRLGLLLARFSLAGPERAGLLHADPHPGNYRLTPDGRLGVMDFGAVARLPDGLPPWIGRAMRACVDDDAARLGEVMREAGMLKPSAGGADADDFGWLLGSFELMARPLATEEFTFDREWMREMMGRAAFSDDAELIRARLRMPPEYALVQRVWISELGMLSQLGARIAYRAEAERALPGFAGV